MRAAATGRTSTLMLLPDNDVQLRVEQQVTTGKDKAGGSAQRRQGKVYGTTPKGETFVYTCSMNLLVLSKHTFLPWPAIMMALGTTITSWCC
jgi:hypothetical protein